ncbi:MAG: hypothetical protein IJU48_08945 [Synergistaceae bacterium]|nr:hypothetical protein [Synergistaceae bacterium]
MEINNNLKDTKINGNFIGGSQYINYIINQRGITNLFNVKIFLHYAGYKISKLLCGENVNNDFFTNNTKLILLLFDDIVISFSDVIQSRFVYDNPFFHEMLRYQDEGNYSLSIIGPGNNNELEAVLAEREEFYSKPGFYDIIQVSKSGDFLAKVKNSIISKLFSTGAFLKYKWQQDILPIYNNTIKICDITNINIKNLVLQNTEYFHSDKVNEFLNFPEKLNNFPFIWDSVMHLKLVNYKFNGRSVMNIENYIASEWIKCYIENLSVVIPNALININDCSFSLSNVADLKYIIRFLRRHKLLNYILRLNFEDLIKVRDLCSQYIRDLINNLYSNGYIINYPKPDVLSKTIETICSSNKSDSEKIQDIVYCLCDYVRLP